MEVEVIGDLLDSVRERHGSHTVTALTLGLANHDVRVDSDTGAPVGRISAPDSRLPASDRDLLARNVRRDGKRFRLITDTEAGDGR